MLKQELIEIDFLKILRKRKFHSPGSWKHGWSLERRRLKRFTCTRWMGLIPSLLQNGLGQILRKRILSVLTLDSSAIHWLGNLFPSLWLFLVLFWMLWMLVTVFKMSHMTHALGITTWGTLFTERLFSVSKEWVRSWSHGSLIIYDKTFAKKLNKVRPKSCREVEREKEW